MYRASLTCAVHLKFRNLLLLLLRHHDMQRLSHGQSHHKSVGDSFDYHFLGWQQIDGIMFLDFNVASYLGAYHVPLTLICQVVRAIHYAFHHVWLSYASMLHVSFDGTEAVLWGAEMSIMKEIPLVHKGQNMCWIIYKLWDFEKKGSLNLENKCHNSLVGSMQPNLHLILFQKVGWSLTSCLTIAAIN